MVVFETKDEALNHMSPETIRKNESHLRSRRAELYARLEQRDGIRIEAAAEGLDAVQNSQLREFAVGEIDRNSRQLREIESALSRIEAGEYGICLSCDEEIGPKRLAALPWATRCVRCQDRADREWARSGDSQDLPFDMMPAA